LLRLPPTHTLFPYTTLFRSFTVSMSFGLISETFPVNTAPSNTTSGPVPAFNDPIPRIRKVGDCPGWPLPFNTCKPGARPCRELRSEEHTSELQSRENLVCRL